MTDPPRPPASLPGTAEPRRFRPRLQYELLVCGVRGHELVGTDVRDVRPDDALFLRQGTNERWHRCLRCDSWLPLAPPASPTRDVAPAQDDIDLPSRGKALRDKVVLRVIAIDRALHFLVLGALGVAILVFANHRSELQGRAYAVLADLQGGLGHGNADSGHGILHEIHRAFTLDSGTLHLIGIAVLAYGILEGIEAIGLWRQRRWAEYLTFVATTVLLPLEIYELTSSQSPLKILAFVINVAVVAYLLYDKRLFGLRGGAAADEAERHADSGWDALERATPHAHDLRVDA
jgi:uncharacterized membrane protein (DUF2068 family)